MSILYLFHHGFDLLRLCYVAFDHERFIQLLRHVQRVGLIFVLCIGDVVHHALRSTCAERFDHLRADSARAARDQHNFPGKIQWIAHND